MQRCFALEVLIIFLFKGVDENTMENSLSPSQEVTIRPFRTGDESGFRILNEQWIERYFKLESKDQSTFADPQSSIIEQGGEILIATLQGHSVGCCALVRMGESEYEIAKMAVSPDHQGRGIGRLMLSAVVTEAQRLGASKLYLETNQILKPAIALYESMGFKHIDPSRVVPSPYTRADVYMELLFEEQGT